MIRFFVFCMIAALLCTCNPDEDLPVAKDEWKKISSANGLPSDFVLALAETKNGQVWIGTDRGLAIFENGKVTPVREIGGITVNAILEDVSGLIWIGHDTGIFILEDGEWISVGYFQGARVTSIVQRKTGEIWIGTSLYGVVKYDPSSDKFTQYYDSACEDCNTVFVVYEDIHDDLWQGTWGGMKKLTGGAWTLYKESSGLPGQTITALANDSWGNLWIGSFDGTTVGRHFNNNFYEVELANGATQNWIYDIQEDKNGELWISTVANGVIRYDGVIMTRVTDGLPGDTFTALMFDSKHNMWMGTHEDGVIQYPVK